MGSSRWRVEAAIAVFLFAVLLIVGGIAILVMMTRNRPPIHENAAAVQSTPAAEPAARYSDAVDESRRLARSLAVDGNLPGLSVAVAVDGDIVWAEGFGWADNDHAPVTPRTRFRLGALSKPLTAAAVALLHDRGRLDLDAPVQKYVPAYPQKTWTITTRQLMGDVAGVHRIRGDNNDSMPTEHCSSVGDAVALLHDDRLLFEPGTEHRYSIWGWVLVSGVVEGAAGEPFAHFMVHEVFEPLGMERTVTAESGALDNVALFSNLSPLGNVEEVWRPDYSCLAGAGAFLSTPSDLVRLGSAMLKPGLLKADTIAAFQAPTRLVSGASTTYALGWTVGTAQLAGAPTRMVSHRGSPALGTVSLLTFPDLGLAVAAAANAQNAKGVDPFAQQVAAAFARHSRP